MHNETTRPDYLQQDRIAILIPVFDDWESLAKLLPEIDAVLGASSFEGHVIVVDDGSTLAAPTEFRRQSNSHFSTLEFLRLRCNLGHQRAIAVGMTHLSSKLGAAAKAVVIMDGDGEDRPEDIPSLVTELFRQQCDVVFAARTKRTEGYTFRLMYFVYRLVFWLLTGAEVRVGNFSALSRSALSRLVVSPDVWNHYAATVLRSRMRFSTLSLPRGKRYLGESHMRYSRLVAHGLSSVAIFGEVAGARLIILFSGVLAILLVLLGMELFVRLFTPYIIPGWATIATGVLLLFTLQGLLSVLIFALTVLGRRSQARTIPLRDAELFLESVVRIAN
jgi:glycosyltransferase involved in cell wall biosynthesis